MKKAIKYSIITIIILIFYYLLSIYFNNGRQFVNYYFYPSSSIKESKEKEIYIKEIPELNIKVKGNKVLEQNIRELVFWVDKSITRKNFGFISLFSYSTTNKNDRVLRISYKNSDMRFSSDYKILEWISFDNGKIESLTTTFGKSYHINDVSIIHFYDENKKEIGTATISIN
jgi:hypothetical protein